MFNKYRLIEQIAPNKYSSFWKTNNKQMLFKKYGLYGMITTVKINYVWGKEY